MNPAWNDVYTLLVVIEKLQGHPQLKDLLAKAQEELKAHADLLTQPSDEGHPAVGEDV